MPLCSQGSRRLSAGLSWTTSVHIFAVRSLPGEVSMMSEAEAVPKASSGRGEVPAAATAWYSKYYAAEPHLAFVNALFLMSLACNALAKLAMHLGLFGHDVRNVITRLFAVPFLVLLVAQLTLWVRAALKVRKAATAE